VAPGQPRTVALPMKCRANEWQEVRVHTGPKPTSGVITVVIGAESGVVAENTLTVYVNGELTQHARLVDPPRPRPDFTTYGFTVPLSAMKRGYNVIELLSTNEIEIGWVEVDVRPAS